MTQNIYDPNKGEKEISNKSTQKSKKPSSKVIRMRNFKSTRNKIKKETIFKSKIKSNFKK